MKSLKKLFVLLLAAIFVLSLASCGGEAASAEVTLTVNARDIDGNPLVLGEVTFKDDTPTVIEALQAMCTAREVACEIDAYGGVASIGGVGTKTYKDKETDKDMAISWTWSLNGTDAETLKSFANETAVKSGDTIEFYQYSYVAEADAWFENAAEFEEDDGQ